MGAIKKKSSTPVATEVEKPKRKMRKYRIRKKKKFLTGEHLSTKTGLRHKYRSSWERDYMQWLDAEPTVLHYDYESVIIPYIVGRSKKPKRYFPDFIVDFADGTRVIFEIKSSNFVSRNRNVAKFVAARQFCADRGWKFEILTEVELKALGLLKRMKRAARVIKKEKSDRRKRKLAVAAKAEIVTESSDRA